MTNFYESRIRNNTINSNFLFDYFFELIRKTAKLFYFKVLKRKNLFVPSLNDTVHISNIGWDHLHEKIRSKFDNIARYFALPKIVAILQDPDIKSVYEVGRDQKNPTEFWTYLAVVDGVKVKVVIRSVKGGPKHFYSIMWRGEVKNKTKIKRSCLSHVKRTRGIYTPQLQQKQYSIFLKKLSRAKLLLYCFIALLLYCFYDLKVFTAK